MGHTRQSNGEVPALAGFPPKVFLIGAQKSGTTFLAGLLDQHPEIELASPKEPHYFTRFRDRDLAWYRQCFPTAAPDRVLVDASPSYSAAPENYRPMNARDDSDPYSNVPERIARVSPDARIIYIVRDPVARIYSAYWHNRRNGTEHRGFRAALAAESHYRRRSDYHAQISLYLDRFPRDCVLVLRFEDLVRRPEHAARQCFDFLGLRAEVPIELDQGRNQSFVYPAPLRMIDRILKPVGGLKKCTRIARSILPLSWFRTIGQLMVRKVPPLDEDTHRAMLEDFEPMAERFESLTGVRLYPWAERNGSD